MLESPFRLRENETTARRGLTAGVFLHPILKIPGGHAREVQAGFVVLAALCGLYFFFGLVH